MLAVFNLPICCSPGSINYTNGWCQFNIAWQDCLANILYTFSNFLISADSDSDKSETAEPILVSFAFYIYNSSYSESNDFIGHICI